MVLRPYTNDEYPVLIEMMVEEGYSAADIIKNIRTHNNCGLNEGRSLLERWCPEHLKTHPKIAWIFERSRLPITVLKTYEDRLREATSLPISDSCQ